MRQLENIITKLKSDPFFAVTISNRDNFRQIAVNITGAQMEQRKGTVEDYFNSLFEDGIKNIGIEVKRKNGSTFKSMDEFVNFTLQDETTAQPAQSINPTHPAEPLPGLLGAGGLSLPGLGQVQLAHRYIDYDRVVADNLALKADNKALKDENDRLKYEALENKFAESKAAGNQQMLTGLIPTILQTLPALLGKAPALDAAGLGTPAGMPQVSEPKAMLIQQLMEQSDAVCDNLYVILEAMTTNVEFSNELIQLLEKFQLTS